jgi:hypothetical protein
MILFEKFGQHQPLNPGRCWVYVRDDRPFGGPAPPAAMELRHHSAILGC